MKRNQVFVRAKKDNKWESVDILDLDLESFKAFVIEVLFSANLICGIRPDFVEGEDIEYKTESKEPQ